MAQIFHPSTNTGSKATLAFALVLVVAMAWIGPAFYRSSFVTEAGVAREQPVPFSHKHHVKEIGIDCRYCHVSVETGSFAGMPSTKTCMNCHSQIWSRSPMLEPVRESWRTKEPLRWTRVHDLPDFVYFNHSIHVKKGVACTTCHGNVEEMPLMWKEATLHMEWCLDCHRAPEKQVGHPDAVFLPKGAWKGDPAPLDELHLEVALNCSDCHR